MFWLVPRALVPMLLVGLGALVGAWVGRQWGWPVLGAVLGGMAGSAAWTLADTLRAGRLMSWLSGTMAEASPPLVGLWGEAGLRMERALRNRERETLREQERLTQFLEAIEASPNGVMLLDINDQILWTNRVAADQLGLHPQRDLRQRVTNLVRAPAFVSALHERGAQSVPVQIPGVGGRGLISVLLRPYGEGQRLMLTQDVTERERADAMRRDFVANVSHEIRTPLTVLAGFVETMVSLPLSDEERRRVLSLMGQQTQRMQALVGDLLTLARLEGSPKPAVESWWRLDRVGRQVESDARALSSGRHALSFDWGEDLEVAGNEGELLSAVANLVNNAVRYTPEHGQVSVSTQQREDGGLEIAVVDTGPGIAAEHVPRLTERFYRVDSSRSRDTGGTGLGLSIVKHVAQRHGGELRIHSVVGQGSQFIISLPAMRVRQREVHAH
ncbi:phosphate regulon sensor histidine kinase PhoR [Ideonella paludis]|uniref:histidine kinase n=1 Tax=Ideonella paludis TaxID=1233411 RepID=A0ABS5DVK7_9BURK|nr:phosphate regulon sensor histidine kinase PhoR [Ideonella paludis]MBQ0935129.1 phosphate regulon sensor histidine kinase PhoR [Ideonella paludis]